MAKRILIVDDAALMRMTILNLLKDDPQLEVVGRAKNGAEALKLMEQEKPDLVLLDIEMPVMDGLTFLRNAKPRFPAKFVVLSAVTGLGSPKAFEARRLGADAVITKPSGSVSMDLEEKKGGELRSTIYGLLGLS